MTRADLPLPLRIEFAIWRRWQRITPLLVLMPGNRPKYRAAVDGAHAKGVPKPTGHRRWVVLSFQTDSSGVMWRNLEAVARWRWLAKWYARRVCRRDGVTCGVWR